MLLWEDDQEIVQLTTGMTTNAGDTRNFEYTQIPSLVPPRGNLQFSALPGTFECRTVRPSVRFDVPYTVSDTVTARRFVRRSHCL